MNKFSNNRALILIIAILLISNIALIFLVFNRNKETTPPSRERQGGGFTEFLRTDIGFTPGQITAYDSLKLIHRQKMKPLFEDLQKTKTTYFLQLRDSTLSTTIIDSSAAAIGEKQVSLDKQLYTYFSNLRKICTPNQLQKFDSLFPQVIKRMTSGQSRDSRNRSSAESKKK